MGKRSRFCGPSDEWIVRLSKAGCPLDRTVTNNIHSRGQKRAFLLRPATGGCRVFDTSHLGGTGYEIGVRIDVLRSPGIIISDWWFTSPWRDHFVSWGLERRQSGSAEARVNDPSEEELLAVLDDRQRVTPAKPLEGWLYGQSLDSIPDDVANHSFVFGELTVKEENGTAEKMRIRLQVDRSAKVNQTEQKPSCRVRLFEKPDSILRP